MGFLNFSIFDQQYYLVTLTYLWLLNINPLQSQPLFHQCFIILILRYINNKIVKNLWPFTFFFMFPIENNSYLESIKQKIYCSVRHFLISSNSSMSVSWPSSSRGRWSHLEIHFFSIFCCIASNNTITTYYFNHVKFFFVKCTITRIKRKERIK